MHQLLAYFRYLLAAKHGRVNGPGSEFIMDFYERVVKPKSPAGSPIEKLRKEVSASAEVLEVVDLGASTRRKMTGRRKLGKIMKQTALPRRYGPVLTRLVRYAEPASILELGTGLAISTAYMAEAGGGTRIVSLEGSPEIAAKARQYLDRMGHEGVQLLTGRFSDLLPSLTGDMERPLMVFIDGDHDENKLLENINRLLPVVREGGVVVIDDIHLSQSMEKAWKRIRTAHPEELCIDLFRMGILFFGKGGPGRKCTFRL